MEINRIIDKYYSGNADLLRILTLHSQAVASKALAIASARPDLDLDKDFLYKAAMLHDIGIVKCDAAGIKCFGPEPYIRHGLCGGQMIRENAELLELTPQEVEAYARVCERHTGAGLSAKDIREQKLPLPEQDFLPETLEEKLICYADKFYSKTHIYEEKPYERVLKSMKNFGPDTVERFLELHNLFK